MLTIYPSHLLLRGTIQLDIVLVPLVASVSKEQTRSFPLKALAAAVLSQLHRLSIFIVSPMQTTLAGIKILSSNGNSRLTVAVRWG